MCLLCSRSDWVPPLHFDLQHADQPGGRGGQVRDGPAQVQMHQLSFVHQGDSQAQADQPPLLCIINWTCTVNLIETNMLS